jgi:hypothetical protein
MENFKGEGRLDPKNFGTPDIGYTGPAGCHSGDEIHICYKIHLNLSPTVI